MRPAVRRAWLAFWVSAFTGMTAGVTAIVHMLTESLWYAIFVAVDFASVALITWAVIQLRRAEEADRAEAAHRETVVRTYVEAMSGGDRLRG